MTTRGVRDVVRTSSVSRRNPMAKKSPKSAPKKAVKKKAPVKAAKKAPAAAKTAAPQTGGLHSGPRGMR